MNKWVSRIDKTLAFCFYAIFFLVPLVIYPSTFELFEFNKMWITFGITLVIGFLWISKMCVKGKIEVKKTPFDLPLLLFLGSQFISTIFSLDPYVSFWGYYSRFNGGLLSTICYIFLYYAFASNLTRSGSSNGNDTGIGTVKRQTVSLNKTGIVTDQTLTKSYSYRLLLVSLLSGTVVALWGFPSHFGFDPTCFFFRFNQDIPFFDNFNVKCWTDAFQPKIRMFSTLGQPNWLAAYLSILIPIAVAFLLKSSKHEAQNPKQYQNTNDKNSKHFENLNLFRVSNLGFLILSILFYIDLLYTRSQSGFVGFWVGMIIFIFLYGFMLLKQQAININGVRIKVLGFFIIVLLLISFIIGTPLSQLDKFTFQALQSKFGNSQKTQTNQTKEESKPQDTTVPFQQEFGGTDSKKIRFIVWSGALEIFKQNPLIGSGVETFAYAYYKVKPISHNLTSEWDYLYNKAHNEYLNYLATTGILGLGSYLLFIGWFLFICLKYVLSNNYNLSSEDHKSSIINHTSYLLVIALVASYVSVLVSNFFGFSVVIINLYIFLIPLICADLIGIINNSNLFSFQFTKQIQKQVVFKPYKTSQSVSPVAMVFISIAAVIFLYSEFLLFRYWIADQEYALGYNSDKARQYQQAYDALNDAVKIRPSEDLYKDELAVNLSVLTAALAEQNKNEDATRAGLLAEQLSNIVIANHPNNVVYYKSRTKIFYALSRINKKYFDESIVSLKKAAELAPTDAKIQYNLGLLYSQKGLINETIAAFKKSIALKPNYRDSYYGLALFYSQVIKDQENKNLSLTEKLKDEAINLLEFSLKKIEPNDKDAKELLESLKR